MNRIKNEPYHGAAGYDAIARRKIKELEDKVGGGSGGGGGDIIVITANDDGSMTCNMTFEEVVTLRDKYPRAVLNGVSYGNQYGFCDCCIDIYWPSGTENSVYFAFLQLPMFARLKYYPDGRLEMAEYIDNIFAQGQG